MKIKTAKVIYGDASKWSDIDGLHVLDSVVAVRLTSDRVDFDVVLSPGFRCDGLSVPKPFRWFLPSWSTNALYNLAGAIHDYLYSQKGVTRCVALTREDCDDVFRGILRESGIGRFRAGCADKAVELFAGGKAHWGNDDYSLVNYCDWFRV